MLERPVSQIIDQALKDHKFGRGFEFRDGQREVVEAICNAYAKDPNATIVIDAPTGTGKSLIAMWSSFVLKEMGKRGYMVTSDLTLQDQYEEDFARLKLNWPSIKGVDNYECVVNGLPFSLGDCKLKGMGYEAASKLPCYDQCEYLQNRERAINQPVALLNYSFWLIQRNYVAAKMSGEGRPIPFEQRDFVFFDEAHKIDEVVQNHFSPRVDNMLENKIHQLNLFLNRNNIETPKYTKNQVNAMIHTMMVESDRGEVYTTMKAFERVLYHYGRVRKQVNKIAKSRFGNNTVSRDWQKAFTTFDRLKDIHCKFEDYIDLIDEVGVDKMVLDQGPEESKFMCVEEQTMIKNYMHKKAGFKVFMSATIGEPTTYMKIMGLENASFMRLGNTFNYDKSPVVFVNRHKLTFKEREANLPKVVQILDSIISKHKGQRGIIHTGSYMFTDFIKKNSKHTFRLMDYENSKEKAQMIDLFKKRDDAVLMGPSLLEGLDLKDETSRFQIFFKVPYPSLADPLIKAKMQHTPGWYDWKTGISIMQGVGRSVRSKDDWAVTYIIDASFRSLINKPDFFPPSFIERVKTVK